jgi:hypothetical protein
MTYFIEKTLDNTYNIYFDNMTSQNKITNVLYQTVAISRIKMLAKMHNCKKPNIIKVGF